MLMIKWLSTHYLNPDQIRLEQILGATTITLGRFRDKQTGYPLSFVVSRGHLLRSERFRRNVLDDKGVLANDLKMAIAIQGSDYERDVVAAYERDEWFAQQGWHVRWISRHMLHSDPDRVRAMVSNFI